VLEEIRHRTAGNRVQQPLVALYPGPVL
jgi:hypothetical protein